MKLARFIVEGKPRLGKVVGSEIIDLSSVAPECGSSMKVLIERLDELRPALEALDSPSLFWQMFSLQHQSRIPESFSPSE